MSDAEAIAAVKEEMGRWYEPNPWDAPAPRRPRPQRRTTTVAEKESVTERREEAEKPEAEGFISDKQWDLFEQRIGYK